MLEHFLINRKTFYRVTACNATHGIAKAILSVCLSVCQKQMHRFWHANMMALRFIEPELLPIEE